jgi:hypothetical protein
MEEIGRTTDGTKIGIGTETETETEIEIEGLADEMKMDVNMTARNGEMHRRETRIEAKAGIIAVEIAPGSVMENQRRNAR